MNIFLYVPYAYLYSSDCNQTSFKRLSPLSIPSDERIRIPHKDVSNTFIMIKFKMILRYRVYVFKWLVLFNYYKPIFAMDAKTNSESEIHI